MPEFHLLIADWYRLNKRSLPWRNTKNPYFIWLSEIILQQTRVNQGMDYYLKFVENYPEIALLAAADEQEVLSLWQGLGYYSRARNLHHAAKMVVDTFNGIFPVAYKDIKSLKGVGDYTAAAISSFAFDLPHAVVDGNVYRVLSRVFDIDIPIDSGEGKKVFDALAQELLGENPPAIHNQAIMEFGALQCVPVNPDCQVCPLIANCLAYKNGTIEMRPLKEKKIKSKNRYFHFMEFNENDRLYLEKRMKKDIWQHLFQFPMIEVQEELDVTTVKQMLNQQYGMLPVDVSEPIKHILTHQRIYAYVWKFDSFPAASLIPSGWLSIQKSDLQDYPIPRLLDRYLSGAKEKN